MYKSLIVGTLRLACMVVSCIMHYVCASMHYGPLTLIQPFGSNHSVESSTTGSILRSSRVWSSEEEVLASGNLSDRPSVSLLK